LWFSLTGLESGLGNGLEATASILAIPTIS
jgi:hypothetical protein